MSLERYSFCFLRYVHDPLPGEFANVGVLLWAPGSRFLGFRVERKYQRLSDFFDGFHAGDYRQLVSRIETQFQRLAEELGGAQRDLEEFNVAQSARDLALKVIPHDDAALQWSISGGGLTNSPLRELEMLFHENVGRHYESSEPSRRDDLAVYRKFFSAAFESPAVKPYVSSYEVRAPLAAHLFPQAWQNGVWNVYQALSFDLKVKETIRLKAHRWESLTRFLMEAPERPRIHLLLGAPSRAEQRSDFGIAKDILSRADAVLIEEDEAEDFSKDLEDQIRRSGPVVRV